MSFVDLNPERAQEFFSGGAEGPIFMLNLLRFREVADYSRHPELAPKHPISGEEAYRLYLQHAEPFVHERGGSLLLNASCGPLLIGPDGEKWDRALIVRQKSLKAFLSFASDKAYLAGLGHRTAALADSRLLPFLNPILKV